VPLLIPSPEPPFLSFARLVILSPYLGAIFLTTANALFLCLEQPASDGGFLRPAYQQRRPQPIRGGRYEELVSVGDRNRGNLPQRG